MTAICGMWKLWVNLFRIFLKSRIVFGLSGLITCMLGVITGVDLNALRMLAGIRSIFGGSRISSKLAMFTIIGLKSLEVIQYIVAINGLNWSMMRLNGVNGFGIE